ncbi:hypothetical protein, unlikely [Trypanosoma brucei gambiense DAL972]|uniref:Uncharacterized protein n=1 Tax=Trypanosoma brucei gambiense (strain MHOM/CI/86/DAL972) TaxID=679716 RepID=D0A1J1_TRYB9|nr:hypothetical protein, unlikely [Trypanosoma brucei gambiense DAL972]XP_011777400.1 hypothetical protein, unlikely [Trypanosoma brucei gambiense DAL972]CBH15133.1 hypothetical protein, unlikely [Trypanosoma brucei gambiense DAL972]CBH15134.1 hypothetical protein, unlikely [Trypanosoma brucei gambiense DAL972]|eukprot:XP_011777399.1 hypothetical protein, unlikely [Trypanosoma brucei gambiense DAL972]
MSSTTVQDVKQRNLTHTTKFCRGKRPITRIIKEESNSPATGRTPHTMPSSSFHRPTRCGNDPNDGALSDGEVPAAQQPHPVELAKLHTHQHRGPETTRSNGEGHSSQPSFLSGNKALVSLSKTGGQSD